MLSVVETSLSVALRTGRGNASAERNGSDLISSMIRRSKGNRQNLSKQVKADPAVLSLSTLRAESLKMPGTLETALPSPAAKETIERAAELLASLAATAVA